MTMEMPRPSKPGRDRLETVAVFAFIVWLYPLNVGTVLPAAMSATYNDGYSYLDRTYNYIQGRPFETSPSFLARKVVTMKRIEAGAARIEAEASFSPIAVARLVRLFRREMHRLVTSQSADWRWLEYYSFYQAASVYEVPWTWLIDRLGSSEIHAVLLIHVCVWLGLGSLFLLTRSLTGSRVLACSALLMPGTIAYLLGQLGGTRVLIDTRLWCSTHYLPTLFTVHLGTLLIRLPGEPSAGRRCQVGLCALGLGLMAVVSLYLRPFVHRPESLLVAIIVLAVGCVRLDSRLIMRGFVALAAVQLAMLPFRTYCRELWSPVTTLDHGASAAFVPASGFFGVSERPNAYAVPPIDYAFTLAFRHDPLLYRLAPDTVVHHSFRVWGVDGLKDLIVGHPLVAAEILVKRIYAQLRYLRAFSFGLFDGPRGHHAFRITVAGVVLLLLVLAEAALSGVAGTHCAPLLGVLLWNVLGLNSLFTIIHIHGAYSADGVRLLACVLPLLAALAWRHRGAWAVLPRAAMAIGRRLPAGRLRNAVIAAAIVLAVLLIGRARDAAHAEDHAVQAWYKVHASLVHPFDVRPATEVDAHLQELIRVGGYDPGIAEMHAAWILYGYRERLPGYRAAWKTRGQPDAARDWDGDRQWLDRRIFEYYWRALHKARSNSRIPARAKLIHEPMWPSIYATALEEFPDHPEAAMMTLELATEAGLPPDGATEMMRRFEREQRVLLERTASLRPGYEARPQLASGVHATRIDEGLEVTLAPNQVLALKAQPLWNSDRARVLVYLDPRVGHAVLRARAIPSGAVLAEVTCRPADLWRYRQIAHVGEAQTAGADLVSVEIQAGPDGVVLHLRDYYPIVENPRFFRRRGLIDPEKLRAQWLAAPRRN
jgi:hypothetical protein